MASGKIIVVQPTFDLYQAANCIISALKLFANASRMKTDSVQKAMCPEAQLTFELIDSESEYTDYSRSTDRARRDEKSCAISLSQLDKLD